jgi:hypothetical protein
MPVAAVVAVVVAAATVAAVAAVVVTVEVAAATAADWAEVMEDGAVEHALVATTLADFLALPRT